MGFLWLGVGSAAVLGATAGLVGDAPAASQGTYLATYAALSFLLAAVLAGLLLTPFRMGRRPRARTVAPAAFLLAVLLHITAWGVAASRWLVAQQPQLGTALWTFALLSLPFALGLTALAWRRIADAPPATGRATPWGTGWILAISAGFLALFALTGSGAAATAASINSDWFPPEIAGPAHLVALATVAILVAAVLAAWSAASRHGRAPAYLAGPLAAAVLLLAASLAGLLLVDGPFRANTGLVLFASYGSALFPSYGVAAVLLRLPSA